MKWTLFLSRITWIFNACFLLSLLLRWVDTGTGFDEIKRTLVVAGWVLAPIMNAFLVLIGLLFRRQAPPFLLQKYYAVYLVILLLQLLFITRLI
ncbi:MAG: hypothetical protein ACK5B4_01590 [Bacteroidota bacterium]